MDLSYGPKYRALREEVRGLREAPRRPIAANGRRPQATRQAGARVATPAASTRIFRAHDSQRVWRLRITFGRKGAGDHSRRVFDGRCFRWHYEPRDIDARSDPS